MYFTETQNEFIFVIVCVALRLQYSYYVVIVSLASAWDYMYSVIFFTKKQIVYPAVSSEHNILQLYPDKSYIIMEMVLPDAKKLRKGSTFFFFS
jgi:hypothetical protein